MNVEKTGAKCTLQYTLGGALGCTPDVSTCAPMCLDIHWIYSAVHRAESYTVCWMHAGLCTTVPCMYTGMYIVKKKALA